MEVDLRSTNKNMQKIIKLGMLLLVMSNVRATMMPERCEDKIRDKVVRLHKCEIAFSEKIGKEIADIVREELVEGDYVIGKVWNEQQERFLARSDERIEEVSSCLSEVSLKKVWRANRQRRKERKGELLYWQDVRAERLVKEIESRGLNRMEIKKILCENDLATFEKVAWERVYKIKEEMLEQACIKGAPKIVVHLIKEGANVDGKDRLETPLYWAVVSRKPKVVKVLIQAGADVNIKGGLGQTLLYSTLVMGDISSAKLLIDAGVDIDSKDDNNRDVIEYGLWRSTWDWITAKQRENALKVTNFIKSAKEIADVNDGLDGVSGKAIKSQKGNWSNFDK